MTLLSEGATPYAKLDLFQPVTAQKALFEDALNRATGRIEELIPVFGLRNTRISEPGSHNYKFCQPREWVAGFWPGQMWLAYLLSGQSHFRNSARMRRPYFQRFVDTTAWHNHDLGFLFSLSTVADWKLTADPAARALALRAAEALAARWRQPMQCLTCWNPLSRDDPEFARRKAGTIIIDSVENMGLLFWATAETGNREFARIAEMHLETCARHLIRADFSTFHCFEFEPATGAPVGGYTHQGYADDSCWSRGQAWAIHGFAVAFQATGNSSYRETALNLARHFERRLGSDDVPVWDFDAAADGHIEKDSSAGAIAAAGLYLLAEGYANDPGMSGELTHLADRLLAGLVTQCDLTETEGAQGLINNGTSHHAGGLTGVMTPYGDYFYIEALMRALGHTDFFWI